MTTRRSATRRGPARRRPAARRAVKRSARGGGVLAALRQLFAALFSRSAPAAGGGGGSAAPPPTKQRSRSRWDGERERDEFGRWERDEDDAEEDRPGEPATADAGTE